jgi:hypothetical protein
MHTHVPSIEASCSHRSAHDMIILEKRFTSLLQNLLDIACHCSARASTGANGLAAACLSPKQRGHSVAGEKDILISHHGTFRVAAATAGAFWRRSNHMTIQQQQQQQQSTEFAHHRARRRLRCAMLPAAQEMLMQKQERRWLSCCLRSAAPTGCGTGVHALHSLGRAQRSALQCCHSSAARPCSH